MAPTTTITAASTPRPNTPVRQRQAATVRANSCRRDANCRPSADMGVSSATIPVMSRNSPLWPILGALAVGALGAVIAWYLASGDINKEGDWRNGAARFVGMGGAIGLCVGWYATLRLTRSSGLARTGMT